MSETAPTPSGVLAKTLVSRHQFRYYDLLVHVFVVVLLSNLVAQKLCAIGPFTIGTTEFGPFLISGAQVLFPITYIFGDVLVEVYGYSASRRAIWIGFFSAALLALMAQLTTSLPAAPEFTNQEAFEKVFGFVPRVLAASLIAYWCGEFANAFIMAKMKIDEKRIPQDGRIKMTIAGRPEDEDSHRGQVSVDPHGRLDRRWTVH